MSEGQPVTSAPEETAHPEAAEIEVPVVGRKDAARDPHALLTGRPPIQEYLALAQQASGGSPSDIKALMEDWRKASTHIVGLTAREAGAADDAPIEAVAPELVPVASDYLADPVIARSFAFLPTEVGVVDLDKVVVYQKFINLRYAQKIAAILRKDLDAEALLTFSLGLGQARPPVTFGLAAQNAYSFVSESTDLRLLNVAVIEPGQIDGFIAQGHAERVVAIAVGYSSNALNVVQVNGRLILSNGSHRAYALRKAGFSRVPAVIQKVSHRDELDLFPAVKQQADMYLVDPRPPLLKDYFDPELHTIIELPRRLRQVRISYGVEVTEAPAVS
jgi:hypothetical protein